MPERVKNFAEFSGKRASGDGSSDGTESACGMVTPYGCTVRRDSSLRRDKHSERPLDGAPKSPSNASALAHPVLEERQCGKPRHGH